MRTLLIVVAGVLMVAACGGESGGGQAEPTPSRSASPGATSGPSLTATVTAPPPGTTAPAAPPTLAPGAPPPTAAPPELPSIPPNPGNQADVPAHLLDQIRADAAQRVGITPAQVQVISGVAQTWNDGSLGCPQPGEGYTQVQVEGFQVFVQAGARTFDYRTSQTGIKVCEKY